MAASNLRKDSVKALSISQYTLFFFMMLAAILVVVAWVALSEIALARVRLAQSDRHSALHELKQANVKLATELQRLRLDLASWDEIHQQLFEPMFYAHWRTTRALTAGRVPAYVDGIDLYGRDGRILAGGAKQPNLRMPTQVSPDTTNPYLAGHGRSTKVYYFFPVHSDTANGQLLGYVGIRLPYVSTLEALHPLRYVNVATIRLGARAQQKPINLADAPAYIEFATNPNDEFRTAEDIMSSSLLRIALLCAVAALFAYFMITSLVTWPLRKLAKSIDMLREGQGAVLSDAYKQLWPVRELEQLRLAFNDYQTRLDDMHIDLEGKNKELWNLAHFDPLTGIHNRRAFEEDWNRLTARALSNSPFKLAFLLFDCDHFKAINDSYGHHVGDLVIKGIAQSLHAALRSEDRLYRLGGDEFVTLLYDTDLDQASTIAQRCIAQVSQYDFSARGVTEPIQISAGLAWWDGKNPDTLCVLHKQADLAMYHAKKPGQAKLALYTDEIADSSQAVVSTREIRAVYEAISSDGESIEMHYQQMVHLPSSNVDYYEALVRIRHDDGLILPFDIFSVVEARRLEIEFDLAVIDAVARDLERGFIPPGSGVAINISGPSIVNRGVAERLLELAAAKSNYHLGLEITETALITQLSHAAANLEQLRKAGFKISLDDFGSGYSPLRYLSSMPIDIVKFDISLIHSLARPDRQAIIVGKLAQLIRDSGYELVAEGIETQELLTIVTDLGFSHAQGYFIERPQPLHKLARHLPRLMTAE